MLTVEIDPPHPPNYRPKWEKLPKSVLIALGRVVMLRPTWDHIDWRISRDIG